MNLALISKTNENLEIAKHITATIFENIYLFEKNQENFSGVYCPDPQELLKIKIKIPYAYNITPKTFPQEMDFNIFSKFYSQLGGASIVFVSDKKLNKLTNWLQLNSYYMNESIDTSIPFTPKKFFTPKMDIGFIVKDSEDLELIKKVILLKKANWTFHIGGLNEIPQELKNKDTIFYSGDSSRVIDEILTKTQVCLNVDLLKDNMAEAFPSRLGLQAMLKGCVLVSSNNQGNNTHIMFDKFNYIKLDFLDVNTIAETLKYLDKRREKLESLAKEGNKIVRKYFDCREIAKLKAYSLKRELR